MKLVWLIVNKATEPNGFNVTFIHHNRALIWYAIDGGRVLLNAFYENGSYFKRTKKWFVLVQSNSTFLVFIPKIDGASNIMDFKPISLWIVIQTYKKIASEEIGRAAGYVVGECHHASWRKTILDANFISNEMVDSL